MCFGPLRRENIQASSSSLKFSRSPAPSGAPCAVLAGHGYVVAVPEIYHELETAGTVLPYDQGGAEKGNAHKIAKELAAYDSDAKAALDYLRNHAGCTGKLGAIGICIGGHLAFRAAMNPEVRAAVCFYATDIHAKGLGKGKNDNSLDRAGEIKGELLHIWGRAGPAHSIRGPHENSRTAGTGGRQLLVA